MLSQYLKQYLGYQAITLTNVDPDLCCQIGNIIRPQWLIWWPLLTLQGLQPAHSRKTRSIPWLLMPWFLASPGHQQTWYLCEINGPCHPCGRISIIHTISMSTRTTTRTPEIPPKTKLQILKNCQKFKFWNFAQNFIHDTPSEVAW